MEKNFQFNGQTVKISVFSDNIVRVRVGKTFEPTLFERYNIWSNPDNVGQEIENGVTAGDLSVSFNDGVLTFKTGKVERTIDLHQDNLNEVHEYFNTTLNNLRPKREHIIGDIYEWETKLQKFDYNPKYYTLNTSGEIFYGLGESNEDKLILNGKTYLDRVVYVKNEIPIPFFMTKAGYGILISNTIWHGVDICKKNTDKVCVYLPDTDIDFFIFAGDNLKSIIERFTYLTGRSLLLPKFAYGLTYVEQYIADQFEVMRNAATFREKKMPCDMISLEPGWMEKRYDFSVDKKWNENRFYICKWMRKDEPSDGMFTSALKRYGFNLQLWLCCKHDFTAYEERLIGNETDPEIPEWFEHLKQFQNDGAYSFKVDPCHVVDSTDESRLYANGKKEPEMHNLMQTLCVKDMYQGALDNKKRRPMHHFCGGYTSTNKYTASTTGDSGGEIKTLAWILNTGLSGLSDITCDMNVHTPNTLHYCFFTAWCQLNSWSGFSQPWWAGDHQEELFKFYDDFRYSILPYIYSNAIETSINGIPMCRAMPIDFEDEELQNSITQYMFGPSLLVGAFSDTITLPKGSKWIDYWTGKVYEGGQTIPAVYPDNRGGVLFAKEGSFIPKEEPRQYQDCKDRTNYTIEIYPGKNSSYILYEDDGLSNDYKDGLRTETKFECDVEDNVITITVGERKGHFEGMSDKRDYTLSIFSETKPSCVLVNGVKSEFTYEDKFISVKNVTSGKVVVRL